VEGNESFDACCLGEAEEVVEKQVAEDAMVSLGFLIALHGTKGTIMLPFLRFCKYFGGQ
jgi:hypothetical protein